MRRRGRHPRWGSVDIAVVGGQASGMVIQTVPALRRNGRERHDNGESSRMKWVRSEPGVSVRGIVHVGFSRVLVFRERVCLFVFRVWFPQRLLVCVIKCCGRFIHVSLPPPSVADSVLRPALENLPLVSQNPPHR